MRLQPESITALSTSFLRQTRIRPLFIYSFTILNNLLIFLIVGFLITKIRGLQPFLFFLIPVIVNSWYGGLRSGLLSVILSIISIYSLIIISPYDTILHLNNTFIIDFALFIFISIFISFLIDKALQPYKTIAYEKKVQEYIQKLTKHEDRYKKALEEIKARDEFLTIASHELKTPVTSMLLQVQLAIHNIRNVSLAKFSAANLLQMLDSTEQQSKRLTRMVNDLLNTSLITTGRLDLEPEYCDLAKIVNDVVLRFSEKLKKKNTELILKADKQVFGDFDKLRIEQAVTNLISNAIKYGLAKPIEVSVTTSGNKGFIKVLDHGIGIPHSQQEKIFGRFKRAVTSNEYSGLGVGLYITNQIIKAHKGKINIESKPNKGTTFTIELPLKNV